MSHMKYIHGAVSAFLFIGEIDRAYKTHFKHTGHIQIFIIATPETPGLESSNQNFSDIIADLMSYNQIQTNSRRLLRRTPSCIPKCRYKSQTCENKTLRSVVIGAEITHWHKFPQFISILPHSTLDIVTLIIIFQWGSVYLSSKILSWVDDALATLFFSRPVPFFFFWIVVL